MRLFSILALIFLLASILTSLLAFIYPLEIETRESCVWLHVLALKNNINVYDHSRVAFISLNHGPLDAPIKFFIASLLPFLDSWQVIRFPVFLLPYMFLFIAWRLLVKSSRRSFVDILYLGSLGFISLMMLGDANMLLVGRSDATAILFFILLVYVSMLPPVYSLAGGVLGACCFFTNWRFAPAVAAVLILALWRYLRIEKVPLRRAFIHAGSYILGFFSVAILVIWLLFNFNFALYYKHFFHVAANPKAWGVTYFVSQGFIKKIFWPILVTTVIYSFIPEKKNPRNLAWTALCFFILIVSAAMFYVNQGGGGPWYFSALIITVWFFFAVNYPRLPKKSANMLGIILLAIYLVISLSDSGGFPIHLATSRKAAADFMLKLRLAEKIGSMSSDDSFLFRKSYQGELVDGGDLVYGVANSGLFDEEFNKTAEKYFTRLQDNPPDFIVTGCVASPILIDLLFTKYKVIENGPKNLIADRKFASGLRLNSKLFVRNDFVLLPR